MEARTVGSSDTAPEHERPIDLSPTTIDLVRTVALAANTAWQTEDAFRVAVEATCIATGWRAGHVWLPAASGAGWISAVWHAEDAASSADLRAALASHRVRPGHGVVGAMISSRSASSAWLLETSDTPYAPAARSAGLRAGLAFAVMAGDEVAAVLEFFSPARSLPPRR